MTRWLGALDLDLIEAAFAPLVDAPFFVKDAQLRYRAANEAMLRLCGLRARQQLLGATAAQLFPGDLGAHYEMLDRRVLATGQPITDRLELTWTARQPQRWLLFSRLPVRAADGTVVGVLASARLPPQADRQAPGYLRLARLLDAWQRAPEATHDLRSQAAEAGLSLSQLERDCKRVLGLAPQGVVQKLRLDKALALLETSMSVAEIAYACGYTDHSAFSRRFRAATGLSPRRYRADRRALRRS